MESQPLKLLLVDDENSLREPLAEYLYEHYGYLVTQAQSGREALELLRTHQGHFDVALLDQVLDEGPGGLELLKRIKADYAQIEVILFTGWGMEHGLEALRTGAFRYLAKPFNPEELGILIRHAAEYKHLKGEAREKKILAQLMETSAVLRGDQEEAELLKVILRGIHQIGFDRVRLYLLSEDTQTLVGKAQIGMSEHFSGSVRSVADDPYMQRLLSHNRPQIFKREEGIPPPFEEPGEGNTLGEWACIPLKFEGAVIGKISVDRAFSQVPILPEELEPVALFAQQAATAIVTTRLIQETQRRAEELEVLRQTSLAITSILDQDQLLTTIIQEAVQLLHVRRGGIYEYRSQKGDLTIIASYGYSMNILGETLLIGEGMAGKLIASGDPFLLADDYTTWEGRADKYLDQGFRAILEVPLQWQEKRIGVLFMDDYIGRKFDAHDAALLGLFADQAAIALEKARGFTRLHQIQERLDRLIDSSFDAVIAIDLDDRVVVFNERAETMLGYRAEEMVGENVAHLHEDLEAARNIHRTLEKEAAVLIREVVLKDKAGNHVPVLLSATLMRDDQGEIIGQAGFMRDLRQIRLLEDRLRALIQVGNALNELLDLEDVFKQVVDASIQAFPKAHQGALHLYDETANLLILKFVNHEYVWKAKEALAFQVGEGVAGWVFAHKQPTAISHAPNDPRYKRIAHPDVPLHQAMLCVPLLVRGHAIGTLTLNNLENPEAFTDEDLQLLSTFASQAAIAIDNARLFEEANRQTRNLNTLQTLALTLSSSLDLEITLSRVCQAAVEFFRVDHSGLVLFDKEYIQGQVVAEFPPRIKTQGRTIQLQNIPLESQLINEREPVVIPDVKHAQGLGLVGEMMYGEFGIHSTMFVPVISNKSLLGSFSLDAIGHGRRFAPEEVELCKIFAAHVATAAENARLYQETYQHQQLLTALDRASRYIRAEKEVSKLLHQIVVLSVELLNCNAGCLLIHDPHRKELEIAAGYGISPSLIRTRFAHNEGLAGLVTQNGASELVGNYVTWPAQAQLFDPHQYERMAAVPLKNIHNGQVEAVLIVAGKAEALTPAKLEILERFAAQAAIALQTSRLIGGEQRRVNQLSILYQISEYIQAMGDLDQIFHVALTGITAGYGLGFNRAALFLLDEQGNKLVGRLGIGYLDEQAARQDWESHLDHGMEDFGRYLDALEHNILIPTPLDERIKAVQLPLMTTSSDILYDVVKGGRPVVAREDGGAKLPKAFVSAFEPGLPLLVVPLTAQDKIIGLLVADSKFTREPITDEDVKVMTAFANSVALAVEKTRLLEEARQGQEIFRTFAEASNLLVSNQDLNQVLYEIAEQARKASQASWVSLVLIDELKQPRQAIGSGAAFQADIRKIMRPDGLSIEVMQSGQVYRIENVQNQADRVNPFLLEQNIGAALCLPVSLPDKRLGVMWVHFETPRHFLPTEIEALQIYVNQAAIAYDAARRIRDVENMRRAAEALAGVAQLEDVLNQIVQNAQSILGANSAALWIYDRARDRFIPEFSVSTGFPPGIWSEFQKQEPWTNTKAITLGTTAKVMQEGWVGVTEASTTNEFPFLSEITQSLLGRARIRSFQGIALRLGDEFLGVLYVNYDYSRSFSEYERETTKVFANHAALALKNANLLEQFSRARNTAQVVAEVSTLGDLHSTLESIVIGTQEALDCDVVTLYTYYQEEKEFGFPPAMVGVQDPEMVLDLGYVAKNSVPYRILELNDIHVAEITVEDAILGSPFAAREAVKSSVGIPLIVGDHKVGVMFINYRNRVHRFTADELANIRLFSQQAAIAIRNAQLYEQADKKTNTLRSLYEAGKTFTSTLNREEILQRIVEQAARLTGQYQAGQFRYASIHLGKDTSTELVATFPIYEMSNLKDMLMRENQKPMTERRMGIVRKTISTGKPQLIQDVSKNEEYLKIHQETHAELAVPIRLNQVIIGAINVEHPENDPFNVEDMETLQLLAAQAAIAIENASLFEESKRQVEELQKTRDRAWTLVAVAWLGIVSGTWQHNLAINLASIEGLVELAQDDIQQGKFIEKYQSRLDEIKNIVKELQNQPVYPQYAEADVESVLINQLIEDRVSQFKGKRNRFANIRYVLELSLDDTASVRASPEWLRRVVDILVDNATRALHNSKKIEKEIIIRTSKVNHTVRLAIQDTGDGIPKHILEILFQKPIEKKKGEKGSGLGLFLAQTIIQAYGGTLKIEDTGPAGTTIVIQLSLESGIASFSDALPLEFSMLIASNADENYWIPILEKAPLPLGSIKYCKVSKVLKHISGQKHELIILDATNINDTPELVTSIRRIFPEARIIVATSSPTWKLAREVFYAGAIDFVRKTTDQEAILTAIENALKKTPPKTIPWRSKLK